VDLEAMVSGIRFVPLTEGPKKKTSSRGGFEDEADDSQLRTFVARTPGAPRVGHLRDRAARGHGVWTAASASTARRAEVVTSVFRIPGFFIVGAVYMIAEGCGVILGSAAGRVGLSTDR
jgi:hypothetical protein